MAQHDCSTEARAVEACYRPETAGADFVWWRPATARAHGVPLCSSPQFQQEIQHRQNEASRESRKKEKLEKELRQIQMDMDNKQTEIRALQQYMLKSKEELQRLEQQLKEQKVKCSLPSALPCSLPSLPSLPSFPSFFLTGSHVAQAGLKCSMKLRMALNF